MQVYKKKVQQPAVELYRSTMVKPDRIGLVALDAAT